MATDSGIDVGDLVRLARLFTDETGAPTDPESVALVVETPSDQGLAPEVRQATEDELAACAAVLGRTLDDTTGVWTVVIEATEHGLWRYEWRASGGIQSVEPGSFLVRRSRVGSSLASSPGSSGIVAGGVLSGTYPNPGFAVDMATQAELDAVDDRVTTLEEAGGGGAIQKATVTLSSADILDLHNTPVTIVAAPASGKWLLVHRVVGFHDFGTGTYTASDQAVIGYFGGGPTLTWVSGNPFSCLAQSQDYFTSGVPEMTNGPDDVNGMYLRVYATAPITDGDGSLTLTVYYTVEDLA